LRGDSAGVGLFARAGRWYRPATVAGDFARGRVEGVEGVGRDSYHRPSGLGGTFFSGGGSITLNGVTTSGETNGNSGTANAVAGSRGAGGGSCP